jgi:hypothetical protein
MTKPNPTNVQEAHEAAFTGKLNMVHCANHCGLTLKEFKMTFREFLKYNSASDWGREGVQLHLEGL